MITKIFNSRKNLEFYHFVETLAKNTFLLPTVQFWAVLLTNWAKGGISRDVTTLARPCWVSLRQQAQGGRALAAVRSGGLYAVRRQLQIKIFWPDLNFFKKFGKLWRLQRISSVNVVIWRILAWKRVKKRLSQIFVYFLTFLTALKKSGNCDGYNVFPQWMLWFDEFYLVKKLSQIFVYFSTFLTEAQITKKIDFSRQQWNTKEVSKQWSRDKCPNYWFYRATRKR